jgi:hypothetical protein
VREKVLEPHRKLLDAERSVDNDISLALPSVSMSFAEYCKSIAAVKGADGVQTKEPAAKLLNSMPSRSLRPVMVTPGRVSAL